MTIGGPASSPERLRKRIAAWKAEMHKEGSIYAGVAPRIIAKLEAELAQFK